MVLVVLITKAAFAGAIVLGISMIAERVSPRVAGIISGAPLGALISYYFLGIEQGIDFVTESIPHAIAGMSGVLVFVSVFHAVSSRGWPQLARALAYAVVEGPAWLSAA